MRELSSRHQSKKAMDNSNNLFTERNNNSENMEEVGLSFEDILAICSGVDEHGEPNCASSIILQKVAPDGESQTVTEIPLKDTSLDIITYRGCTVIQANFSRTSTFEYKRVYDTVGNWLNNPVTDSSGNTYVLSLVAVPLLLEGLVYLVINSPVYAVGTEFDDGHVFVMSFDTFSIQVFEDEDIDMQAISEEVEAQLAREAKKEDDEIASLEKEYEEASRDTSMNNIYADNVKHDFYNTDSKADETEDDNEDSNNRIRFTHTENPFHDGGDDEK